jgi:hypothetical protein
MPTEVVMRFTGLAAGAACMVMLVCASAAPGAESGVPLMPAAWTTKELNFVYQTGFTTEYTCDGLRDRMRGLLAELGAHDIQVRNYGCPGSPFPGVHIRMSLLQSAHEWAIGRTVPAYWKKVDLLADREPLNAAADCELIEQIRQKVLPLFATRAVDYGAVCQKYKLLPGGTLLTADVLVPDQSVAGSTAAR